MNLGIILSPGDSLHKQKKSGQLDRFLNYYLVPYSAVFKKVFIFSYQDTNIKPNLPTNVYLVPKPKHIPNLLYMLILPLIHKQIINIVSVFRIFQAPGGIPMLLIKKPYVVTYGYHYHQFLKIDNQPIKAKLIKPIIKSILKKAKKIIVTTKTNLNYLEKKGFKSKLVLIPNGVDPKSFKPAKSFKPNLILSVGRLVTQKNYTSLIKAISQTKNRCKISLVIIGQGPLKAKLASLAKQLKVNLKIINSLPHQQLVSWYQQAHLFVLISKTEGHSKALIEALSCGCACLTTAFPGNPITNKKTGLIVRSINQLPKQIDQILTNPDLLKTIKQNARKKTVNNNNIHTLVNQEINLIKSLIK